jgi:hypothetical protein
VVGARSRWTAALCHLLDLSEENSERINAFMAQRPEAVRLPLDGIPGGEAARC